MININYQYLRFSENEGYPNSWMVFVMENPNLKWMMTGGTPVLGNPNMAYDIVLTNMNGFFAVDGCKILPLYFHSYEKSLMNGGLVWKASNFPWAISNCLSKPAGI